MVGSEQARRSGKTVKQEKRNKGKEITTKSGKKRKKFGRRRESKQNMVEETSGNNARGGSTCVLLSIIYRSALYARSLPFGITICGALCFRPLKTHPVVEEPSGASSWTASAGGTSAFSI